MLNTRKYLFGTTLLAGLLAVAAPSIAQTAAPANAQTIPAAQSDEEEAVEVDEIIVTGSRIRRDPTTAPTPLQQVSREALLQSGTPSVIDYLADIPALQNSQVPEDTTGGVLGTGGLSTLSLRALGSNRTLTLVDGRRHAGAAYSSSAAVDIDTIPSLLIENVEIITGAAAAVYGADAVAGVVNFIQRTDVEGLEIDVSANQLAKEGDAYRGKLAILWGGSVWDGRLRGYLSGEYDRSDKVTNADISIMRRGLALYQNDLDPAATPYDGVFDALVGENLQTINNVYGGSLTLSHNTALFPSAADPDIPASACTAQGTTLNTDCFVIDPGFTFAFENGGTRPLDFGTWRAPAGLNRTLVLGSRDARPIQDVDAADRLPRQEAYRFQTGGTFAINDDIDLFGEFKYVTEENEFGSTPIGITAVLRPFTATQQSRILGNTVTGGFDIGLDNAYLPAAIRAQALANTRGGVSDQRLLFRNFLRDLPDRAQTNTRDTWRYVAGLKGRFDNVLGLKDGNWEVSYNQSEVADDNVETNILDMERLMWSLDAVVDTLGRVNGRPGETVCRVRLQNANGLQIRRNRDYQDTATNPTRFYAANDPAITGCEPINFFGASGIPASREEYLLGAGQARGFTFEQKNFLAYVSGSLWDFWGAGSIGIAGGLEYRQDAFSGYRTTDNDRDLRALVGNVYVPTARRSSESTEGFVELQVPLVRDLPFVQSLDISGAYRYADYELFGGQEVYNVQGSWRINDSLLFRSSYGTSIRVPTLNELYRGAAQTFANITDPCDRNVINAGADERVRANRNRNCAALGIPVAFTDTTPGGSVAGLNGNNPNLQPEQSVSKTFSMVLTPTSWPNFNMVLDYYDIEITDAIFTVGIANLLNLCYNEDTQSALACANIGRDSTTNEINSFVQGGLNYAKQTAKGLDFAARYRHDMSDTFGRDLGMLMLSVRGSWTIEQHDFTDPLNPSFYQIFEDTFGIPRVRALTSISWAKGPLNVNWNIDYQPSVEITDVDSIVTNADLRETYIYESGSFTQHDINVRYELDERITLRGGVTNVFDTDPSVSTFLGGTAFLDDYDLYGRRFFVGMNAKF